MFQALRYLVAGMLFATLSIHAHAGMIIDTTWSDANGISWFGEENTATYGQTFTVDNMFSKIISFDFWLNDNLDPDEIDFRGYLMSWDGNSASGPILFQSDDRITTNNGGLGGLEQFTFTTNGINLVEGLEYVAFISASGLFDGSIGTGSSRMAGEVLSGGGFVYLNNGNDASQWTSENWVVRERDIWFRANFEVPLPSTLALIGLVVVGLHWPRCRSRGRKGLRLDNY